MHKSLKRSAEPETFEIGKAVTLIIGKAKELSKSVNDHISQIEYLESKKKQLSDDLERLIQDKADLIKLKEELIAKITKRKNEFQEFVRNEQDSLQAKKDGLDTREAEFKALGEKATIRLDEMSNELEHRSKELEKQERNLVARETAATKLEKRNIEDKQALIELKASLDAQYDSFGTRDKAIESKEIELTAREKKIKESEDATAAKKRELSQLVADVEGQVSLVESQKNKNKTDVDAIRNMNIQLNKRKEELDNREIRLRDREATQLSRV